MKVVVVRTGIANLASVLAALQRAGAEPHLSESRSDLESAERLVVPGVGAFAAAMQQLTTLGLVAPLRERILAGRPTLAICLGMQLFAESSEESRGVEGLGVFPGQITRFQGAMRVPQLGWNEVVPEPDCRLLRPGFAYYANSYRLESVPAGWSGALSDHGGSFVGALERGSVLACQFHPELSSRWGADLIESWLAC